MVALLGAAGAIVAGVGSYLAVRSSDGTTSQSAGSLAVVGAAITVSPRSGTIGCANPTVIYTARVTTNGAAGTLEYSWTYPDNTAGPVSRVRVGPGQGVVPLSLDYTFSGHGRAEGTARIALRPVPPSLTAGEAAPAVNAAAPPVSYVCP